MRIQVTGTPEIKQKQIKEIVDFLNKTKGPLLFNQLKTINDNSLQNFADQYWNGDRTRPFDFENVNSICNLYRDKNTIPKEDIVVVLTSRKILCEFITEKHFFSYFDNNNIIVRDNNWKGCDKINPNMVLAHQIIENIFQILAGYKLQSYNDFHFQSESCINDFCNNEYELQYKIRGAHICSDCSERATNNGMDPRVYIQISNIISQIRDEISTLKMFLNNIKLKDLNVTAEGNVEIGSEPIELTAISKTIYVFFLIHRGESLSLYNLKNYKNQLERILLIFSKSESTKPINTLLGVDSNRKNTDTLKDHRYNIKKAIKNVIGEQLSELYKIGSHSSEKGSIKYYYSEFPSNTSFKVNIDQKFLKHIGFS